MNLRILHILRSKPNEAVVRLIDTMAGDEVVRVVSLYQDDISPELVDWSRLVDDIFNHDKVICW